MQEVEQQLAARQAAREAHLMRVSAAAALGVGGCGREVPCVGVYAWVPQSAAHA